jgi:hypothetical protein
MSPITVAELCRTLPRTIPPPTTTHRLLSRARFRENFAHGCNFVVGYQTAVTEGANQQGRRRPSRRPQTAARQPNVQQTTQPNISSAALRMPYFARTRMREVKAMKDLENDQDGSKPTAH